MRARRFARRTGESAGVNLTPMLDVVFILLIFFLVTASFVKEAGLDVDAPVPPQTPVQPPQKARAILVEIDSGGGVTIDRAPTDVRRVRYTVIAKRARDPELAVFLRTDASATNGTFVRVLDELNLSGAPVRLLTTER